MKILLAPDSFKGSLSASQVCDALKEGIISANKDTEIITLPLADGGEGSLAAINTILKAEEVKQFLKDPFWRPITGAYLRKEDTAYIELAVASGLHLIEKVQRDPELASTYGTGQQIKHAVKNGAKTIYLFIGGSATNDGGIGIAQTLGYDFTDKNGDSVMTIGESLTAINKIIPPQEPLEFDLKIVCDVNNPMYGLNGAAHIYAGQKGADKDAILRLDAGLKNLAERIQKDLGIDVSNLPGGGAAGGVGAGMYAFFNAELLLGSDTIFELLNLKEKLKGIDLVITGEGKIDSQTLSGKLISSLTKATKEVDTPVIAVCGINELNEEESKKLGLKHIYSIPPKEDAMNNAAHYLTSIGSRITKDFMAS